MRLLYRLSRLCILRFQFSCVSNQKDQNPCQATQETHNCLGSPSINVLLKKSLLLMYKMITLRIPKLGVGGEFSGYNICSMSVRSHIRFPEPKSGQTSQHSCNLITPFLVDNEQQYENHLEACGPASLMCATINKRPNPVSNEMEGKPEAVLRPSHV